MRNLKKHLYKTSIIIFILNIICVILSYFWIYSDLIIIPMFIVTLFCAGMLVVDYQPDRKADLWNIFYVGSSVSVIIITFICIVYTFANFYISIAILYHGEGIMVDGIYYLRGRGIILNQISQSEYYKLVLAERRIISAFLLPLSAIPLAYWSSSFKKIINHKSEFIKIEG